MSGGKVVAWLTAQSPLGVKVQPARGERPQHATDLVLQSDLAAAIARAEAAEAAGKRVTDAFRAMSAASGVYAIRDARIECERAMLALDEAIAAQQAEGE